VLILRWFWWRINAWSEIAALASSVVIAVVFEVVAAVQSGASYELFATPVQVGSVALATHHKALLLVPVSVIVWLVVTFRTAPVPQDQLVAFYRRVRPGGAWGAVARECADVAADGLGARTVVAWLAGVVMVYGILFGTGKLLLGDPTTGAWLLVAAAVAAVPVVRELRR
jgi:hypothetical protein